MDSVESVEEDDFVDTLARRMCSGQVDPFTDNVEMQAFEKAGIIRKVRRHELHIKHIFLL